MPGIESSRDPEAAINTDINTDADSDSMAPEHSSALAQGTVPSQGPRRSHKALATTLCGECHNCPQETKADGGLVTHQCHPAGRGGAGTRTQAAWLRSEWL